MESKVKIEISADMAELKDALDAHEYHKTWRVLFICVAVVLSTLIIGMTHPW